MTVQTRPIGEVGRVTMGVSPTKSEVFEDPGVGLPLLNGPTEFGPVHPSPRQWASKWTREAESGDLLFCVRGSTTGRMNRAQMPYAIGRGLASIRGESTSDTRFLQYALEDGLDRLLSLTSGSVFPNIAAGDLRGFEVPWPEAPVRRGIVRVLRAIEDKIDANRRSMSLVEQLCAAEFAARFDVRPASEGVAASELIQVNPKRVLKKGTPATYVGMASLPENEAEVSTWDVRSASSGQRFRNGDVLMARITPCLENGKTAVVDMLDSDEVGWGSTEFIVLAPQGLISTAWIYCFARSEPVRSYAIRGMTGTSGRQRFPASSFEHYRIAEPAADDLVQFNDIAAPLFEWMTHLRDENRSLEQLRGALIPELLAMRIQAPRVEDEADE